MKKFTLLFVVGSFLLIPRFTQASFISDAIAWFIPDDLKPKEVVQTEQRGVGGVLITPNPVILSGDTAQAYFLPTLTSRSFAVLNNGALDLFLNKSAQLKYTASPGVLAGDLPDSLVLNVGAERIISIFNPSTTTNYFLSRTSLSILSDASQTTPTVFVSDTQADTKIVETGMGMSSLASFSFKFILNNGTNNDVYISRIISPSSFVAIVPIEGATTTIKFIEADPHVIAGDSATVFVVPAGTHRQFEITGIINNAKGRAGSKVVAISDLHYSNSATGSSIQTITAPRLRTSIVMGAGELPKLPSANSAQQTSNATAPSAKEPADSKILPTSENRSSTPSIEHAVTPSPTISAPPSVTQSPIPAASPGMAQSPTPAVSPSPISNPALAITSASAVVGTSLVENNETVGFPVTFTFTAKAGAKSVYLSKDPTVAFGIVQTGFGTVPTINNITAQPSIRTGDGGTYFIMPPGTVRTYQAFGVLRNDTVVKAGTQTFEITKINFGSKSTLLAENSTTENTGKLKASVKLAPPLPKPSPSVTPTPTPTPVSSGTPSATSLIALCYAIPTAPETGESVFWQVMQSGATGNTAYSWSGTDGLNGSTTLISRKYSTVGRKDARVTITSGGDSVTTSCYVNIIAAPTPTPIPNPTSTVTPTATPSTVATPTASPFPTSSNVSFIAPARRNLLGAALFSIGEFLDSLIQ